MTNTEPLRTEADYERALTEIEQYFENVPELGTEAADRFNRLAALIKEYEDVNFPICAENVGVEPIDQGVRDDLISRFEEGLMLASDKQHILALLRSPSGAPADLAASEQYEFPYQRAFDAMGAAIEFLSSGGEGPATFSISVAKFQKAFNEHRDAKASPIRALSPAQSDVEVGNVAAAWRRVVDRLEKEKSQLRSQVETWREQASLKDAELTVLRAQSNDGGKRRVD